MPDPAVAPIVEEYKELLHKAGAEIAVNMSLSEETTAALERQLVPTEVYNAQVNMLWDSLISRAREAQGGERRSEKSGG